MINDPIRDPLATPTSTTCALAIVRPGEEHVSTRLQELAGAAGLHAICLPPGSVRARDLGAFGVALVAVIASSDWDVATALAGTIETIVFATDPSDSGASYALRAGAVGYLGLALPDATLVKAIQAIRSGEAGFSRAVLGTWLRGAATRGMPAADWSLSSRQREILERIAQGDTDKEIAQRLGIATATVHKHVQRLLSRLRVPNRAAAVTRRATEVPHPGQRGTRSMAS